MPGSGRTSWGRIAGFASFAAPLLLVAGLAACGGDDDIPSGQVIDIRPSSYIVATTAAGQTTTPGAGGATGEPGTVSAQEQVHVVQAGEFLSAIAADYDVEMDAIVDYNGWTDGINHPLHPNDQVRIPPGAMIPEPDDDEDEGDDSDSESDDENADADADETETTEEESDDPELCPNGERQGTYTIVAGDIPANVADKLNVTLDQLNDANANTPGYRGFIVGIDILVPCGGDETDD